MAITGTIQPRNARPYGSAQEERQDRPRKPKAKVWLNPGDWYPEIPDEEGNPTFVGLLTGVPLDTMDDADTNSRNEKYRKIVQAKNDLRDQLLALAEELAPGEEREVSIPMVLRRADDTVSVAEEQHDQPIPVRKAIGFK